MYKYTHAGMSVLTGLSTKDELVNLFQENLNENFENSSDYFTIEEESPFGSNTYKDVDVRILTHIVTSETGEKTGDDYKKILFRDIQHATGQGYMYRFDNNYWIVSQADIIKNLAASCVVRRCNNVLRWIDVSGGYHEIPVTINEIIKENRDYSTAGSSLVIPAAQLECIVQFNEHTNLIVPNQRFIFGNPGNWHAYKVLGGGVNNYNLLKTKDNMSAGMLRLSLGANYVNNDTDDLTNGICDVYQNVYTLKINDNSVSGNIGNTRQLYSTITFNGSTVTRNVTWTSSNVSVATISSTGLLTMISNGSCTITCNLNENLAVFDTSSITVTTGTIHDYVVSISPISNYVLEKNTQIYNVYLYDNGVQQTDVFVFTLTPGSVPSANYVYTTINGNSFSVKNNSKYLEDVLTINCVSGTNSKSITVLLKGSW